MQKDSNSKLKTWLDNLEQESWQLELLVSGFAIFLLIGIYEPIQQLKVSIAHWSLANDYIQILVLPVFLLLGTWFSLLVNLIIHVILRGLWISTVGLRSVSGDIDFDQLRLAPRYDRFLRQRCGSFDRYIERLEQICSIIFAFTFLLVFALLAIGFFTLCSILLVGVLSWAMQPFGILEQLVPGLVNVLLMLAGLIYLTDFLTLGWLKRQKRLQRIYYPLYRLMGFMTLAFLYRPLYYNLIDNRLGKRAAWLIVPYIILAMTGASAQFVYYTYYPGAQAEQILHTHYYDDLAGDSFSETASLPSKFVQHDFLEIFIPYIPDQDDEAVEHFCPHLEPGQNTGIRISGILRIHQIENRNSDSEALLACMSDIYRLAINDSLIQQTDYRFYDHPQRKLKGVLRLIDVAHLPRGQHKLTVERIRVLPDSTFWHPTSLIPFWKP